MEGPTASQLRAHQTWGPGAMSFGVLEDNGNSDSYVSSMVFFFPLGC